MTRPLTGSIVGLQVGRPAPLEAALRAVLAEPLLAEQWREMLEKLLATEAPAFVHRLVGRARTA